MSGDLTGATLKMTNDAEAVSPDVGIRREGGVAEVILDRRDGRNALSAAAMGALTDAARHLASDLSIQAVILTGAPVFSAGADLKDPELAKIRRMGLMERRQALKLGPDMCQAWEDMEQLTIAAVEGYCIGGGVSLAVSCDIRIAAQDARFRLPEVPLGMNMSWQSNPRLVNLMGPARAKVFTILGEWLEAPRAQEWGLVEDITPPGQALQHARRIAAKAAALPPVAVRMTKEAIDRAAKPLNHATSFMDRDQYALAVTAEDQREAVKAFLEKRKPRFTGN